MTIDDLIQDATPPDGQVRRDDAARVQHASAPAAPRPALLDRIQVDYYGTADAAQAARDDQRARAAAADDPAVRPELDQGDREGDPGVRPRPDAVERRQDHPPADPAADRGAAQGARQGRPPAAPRRAGSPSATSAATSMHHLKELVDNGEVGDDEEHRAEERVQKLTDEHVHEDRRAAEAQGSRDHGGLRPPADASADARSERLLTRPRAPSRRPSSPSCPRSRASVAIIMDGNGRWAERRGLPVADGHRAGTRALRRTVEAAIDLGVESLAVYAFSTENWSRPPDEVDALMEIFGETIERELPDLAEQGVRDALHRPARPRARRAARADGARSRTRRPRTTGSASGSRSTTAAGPSSSRPRGGSSRRASTRDEIDENALAAQLYAPELPDPDLLIRTLGRAADLELPALAARLRGARLRRHALAGLRRATTSRDALADYARAAGGGSAADEHQLRLAASSSRPSALPLVLGLRLARRLVALRARRRRRRCVALHEFYAMTRPLRPLVLAGYAGADR